MALIPETGAGVPGANSYADVAYATAFHGDRGTIDVWQTFLDAGSAQGGLLGATELIESRYEWRGQIFSVDQGLGLPRVEFHDRDGRLWTTARQIAKAADATSLLALYVLQNPISRAGNITAERFPDYSVTYEGTSTILDNAPDIDAMLKGLFDAGGFGGGLRSVKMVRWS